MLKSIITITILITLSKLMFGLIKNGIKLADVLFLYLKLLKWFNVISNVPRTAFFRTRRTVGSITYATAAHIPCERVKKICFLIPKRACAIGP